MSLTPVREVVETRQFWVMYQVERETKFSVARRNVEGNLAFTCCHVVSSLVVPSGMCKGKYYWCSYMIQQVACMRCQEMLSLIFGFRMWVPQPIKAAATNLYWTWVVAIWSGNEYTKKTNIENFQVWQERQKASLINRNNSGACDSVASEDGCSLFLQVYTCKKPKAKWVGSQKSF